MYSSFPKRLFISTRNTLYKKQCLSWNKLISCNIQAKWYILSEHLWLKAKAYQTAICVLGMQYFWKTYNNYVFTMQ